MIRVQGFLLAGKRKERRPCSSRPIGQSGYRSGKRGRAVGERAQDAWVLSGSRVMSGAIPVVLHIQLNELETNRDLVQAESLTACSERWIIKDMIRQLLGARR